jgi:hypothetical protein
MLHVTQVESHDLGETKRYIGALLRVTSELRHITESQRTGLNWMVVSEVSRSV